MKFEIGPPHMVGGEADHPRLAGGRCDKQGNLNTRLALDDGKTGRSLHLPTSILDIL